MLSYLVSFYGHSALGIDNALITFISNGSFVSLLQAFVKIMSQLVILTYPSKVKQ